MIFYREARLLKVFVPADVGLLDSKIGPTHWPLLYSAPDRTDTSTGSQSRMPRTYCKNMTCDGENSSQK